MLSRINFLKLTGFSIVALGAGYTTGRLTENSRIVNYIVHGFIPPDEQIIENLVTSFKNKVKSKSEPVIIADSKLGEIINRIDIKSRKENFSNQGSITYRLKRLNKQVDADIIVSDSKNSVYSLRI